MFTGIGFPTKEQLPPGWDHVKTPKHTVLAMSRGQYYSVWDNLKTKKRVIASVGKESDGKTWVHVSISHPGKIDYADLVYLKRHWLGDNIKAIMVLPEKEMHVNIHPNCLHLFTCIEGMPIPEFSVRTSLGREI